MANTFKFGNGNWAVKDGSALAYNDENNNFKPLPFDFTRASSATTLNRQGLIETVGSGKPRIDFLNNTDGHLLLEPLRRNFLTYSEDFSNWTLNGDSISETSSTAFGKPIWTLTESSSTYLGIFRSATGVTIGTVTASALVKANTANTITLRYGSPTNKNVTFNLSNGTITFESSGASGTITSYGDGWYLCTNTVTTTSSTQSFAIYTNSGSVDVIHAQLEAGSYATSYIPTEGSSVTRVREICEQDSLSNLIGQTEGVIYYDYTATFEAPSTSFDFFPISVSDGSTSNFFFLNNYNQALTVGYKVSGSSIISNNSFTFNSGDRIKVAFAYKQNDFAVYINGTQILTLSSGSVAALSEVTLGNYYNNQISLQDDVKVNELRFYNTRLTNTELQNLTS